MPEANNPGHKAVFAAQSRANAAEAIRAARQSPPDPEQAPPPPPPAEPAAPAAPQTGGTPAPATEAASAPPAAEASPPAAAPAPETPAQEPTTPPVKGPPEKTWQALHDAEKRIAADRAAFKKEREAARDADVAVQAMQQLGADPLSVLQAAGWDEERLAGLLVERHKAGQTGPAPAPVQPAPTPNRWAQHRVEPPAAVPQADGDPRVAKLEETLNQVVGHLGQTMYENAALRDPALQLIAETPGGVAFAIERAAAYAEAAGRQLTPQEALAMAQDELIDQEKARIGKLKVNPQWAKVLELDGSPAAPPPTPPDANAGADSDDEPLTTLSQSNTPTPPAPPIPAGHLTHQAAIQRAADAIRRARQRV